jgi:hypothetical protein
MISVGGRATHLLLSISVGGGQRSSALFIRRPAIGAVERLSHRLCALAFGHWMCSHEVHRPTALLRYRLLFGPSLPRELSSRQHLPSTRSLPPRPVAADFCSPPSRGPGSPALAGAYRAVTFLLLKKLPPIPLSPPLQLLAPVPNATHLLTATEERPWAEPRFHPHSETSRHVSLRSRRATRACARCRAEADVRPTPVVQ